DLYRAFIQRTWRSVSEEGIVTLIHPESHSTAKKAAPLRRGAYFRLRRHWKFTNELRLFEIGHTRQYGVTVYGKPLPSPRFVQASGLFHPRTVEESLLHDGSGPVPGIRDSNDNWDLSPHYYRISSVDASSLALWQSILNDDGDPLSARIVYFLNQRDEEIVAKLAQNGRIETENLFFSSGWHETADKRRGHFDTEWHTPKEWPETILQGSHLTGSNPLYKQPNPSLKHHQDWTTIDLESIGHSFIPATSYKLQSTRDQVLRSYPDINESEGASTSSLS